LVFEFILLFPRPGSQVLPQQIQMPLHGARQNAPRKVTAAPIYVLWRRQPKRVLPPAQPGWSLRQAANVTAPLISKERLPVAEV